MYMVIFTWKSSKTKNIHSAKLTALSWDSVFQANWVTAAAVDLRFSLCSFLLQNCFIAGCWWRNDGVAQTHGLSILAVEVAHQKEREDNGTRGRTNFFTPSLASRCSSLPFLSPFNMLLSSCIHFLQDIFLLGILKPPIAKRCCINEFPMMTGNFFPFTFTKTFIALKLLYV